MNTDIQSTIDTLLQAYCPDLSEKWRLCQSLYNHDDQPSQASARVMLDELIEQITRRLAVNSEQQEALIHAGLARSGRFALELIKAIQAKSPAISPADAD